MAHLEAVWAFVQGVQAYRRRALARLSGSPHVLRLTYMGGHPGIWEPEEFLVGRVGDQLRLVDRRGDRWYDLPLDRIGGLTSLEAGCVSVSFEPTAGLRTAVAFRAEEGGPESYRKLLDLLVPGA
ncbi:MAG TPA: hypothetical protein VD902_12375 [Symbiobacteriaceae bacterium]|nr:hypothetical protein [Symbiobacteriaceae bacterium]